MSVLARAVSNNKVSLLVDVFIVGVEVLALVVVEHAGSPIVLHDDLGKRAHILGSVLASLLSHAALRVESRMIIDLLQRRLSLMLPCLD